MKLALATKKVYNALLGIYERYGYAVSPTIIANYLGSTYLDENWAYNTSKVCYHLKKLVALELIVAIPHRTGGNRYTPTEN